MNTNAEASPGLKADLWFPADLSTFRHLSLVHQREYREYTARSILHTCKTFVTHRCKPESQIIDAFV